MRAGGWEGCTRALHGPGFRGMQRTGPSTAKRSSHPPLLTAAAGWHNIGACGRHATRQAGSSGDLAVFEGVSRQEAMVGRKVGRCGECFCCGVAAAASHECACALLHTPRARTRAHAQRTRAHNQQVKRLWPDDAAKTKGDPWFMAVVTDYDPKEK